MQVSRGGGAPLYHEACLPEIGGNMGRHGGIGLE